MSGFSSLAIVSPWTEKVRVRAGDDSDCLFSSDVQFAACHGSGRRSWKLRSGIPPEMIKNLGHIEWEIMRVSGSSCDSYYAKYFSDASAWEPRHFDPGPIFLSEVPFAMTILTRWYPYSEPVMADINIVRWLINQLITGGTTPSSGFFGLLEF